MFQERKRISIYLLSCPFIGLSVARAFDTVTGVIKVFTCNAKHVPNTWIIPGGRVLLGTTARAQFCVLTISSKMSLLMASETPSRYEYEILDS